MPRKHCRTLVRSRKNLVLTKDTRMVSLLCSSGCWRTISERQAESMESMGQAEKVTDPASGDSYWKQLVEDPSRPSPTTLTKATMEAVANAKNCRLNRAEQRHVDKFRVWAFIGDKKAFRVWPRTTDAERRQAEKLLGVCAA
jgi:hypothetical protein